MSSTPKSKSIKIEKSEWQVCLKCDLIISFRDLTVHNQVCEELSSSSLLNGEDSKNCSSISDQFNHGFISGEQFFALNTEIKLKEDDLKRLPTSSKKHLVFLHPSAMKFLKIGIGDPVSLTCKDINCLALAWPSPNINPASLHPLAIQIKMGRKLIVVERYHQLPIDAKDVYIQTEDLQLIRNKTFHKQLLLQNNKCFIGAGSLLKCNYFGLQTNVTVTKIEDANGTIFLDEKEAQKNVETDELRNLFENINLLSPVKRTSLEYPNVLSSPSSRNDILISNCFRPATSSDLKTIKKMKTEEKQYFNLTLNTRIKTSSTIEGEKKEFKMTYEAIGGLEKEIQTIRNFLRIFFQNTQSTNPYGVTSSNGLLLFGPSGTGKTILMRAIVSQEKNLHFVNVQAGDIFSKYYGETEAKIKEYFENAKENSPSILFLDEIDIFCSRSQSSEQNKRVFSSLLNFIDDLNGKGVMLIAATNKREELDPAIRRAGRLDKEIEIGVPNSQQRFNILSKQLSSVSNVLTCAEIEQISENAHSFTGADLVSVIREASNIATTSAIENEVSSSSPELKDEIKISFEDMKGALKQTKPAGMKEVCIEVPKVLWSDIGGMKEVKAKLIRAVEWPLKHPESFKRLGVQPPRGLLMYGPPGCSKTMIAKALATESQLNFLAIKGPELFNKWVGESERAVRELFRKARAVAPSIIFFDEIDALAGERGSSGGGGGANVGNRVLAQLLTEMDGIEMLEGVTVVAATNRPDMIDQALLRPGRLDSIVYVPLPDRETRREIFALRVNKMPVTRDVSIETLAIDTEGYSGAEIVAVCQEAGMEALAENVNATEITLTHFEKALKVIQPRTSEISQQFYAQFYQKSNKMTTK